MQVKYVDHMGTDLTVVNAARVSFAKASEWEELCECGATSPCYTSYCSFRQFLRQEDVRLINFLARGMSSKERASIIADLVKAWGGEQVEALLRKLDVDPHWSPFAHTSVQLHIKAPIFVARQLAKHQVGGVWNEVSRRYVEDAPEFWWPERWRSRAVDKKQGSGDGFVTPPEGMVEAHAALVSYYPKMLENGIAPELARIILPPNMYTEWYWTGSLLFFARVCKQRLDSHAQEEAGEVARQIAEIVEPLFPVSWQALVGDYE